MKKRIICTLVCILVIISTIVTVSGTMVVEKISNPLTNGNILYVGGSGPGNYTTIQNAIDNASDGDTIFVYSGIYYGVITIDKTVMLTGEEKTSTMIDGQQLGEDTITVTAPKVHLSGFTICNSPRGGGYNAGLKLEYADESVIEHNIFTDNCWAAEIRSSSSCIFFDNSVVDNEQGGVHLPLSTFTQISGCTFSGNGKKGLEIFNGNDQVISSNTFIDCGIELYAEPPPGNFVHCTITDNMVNGKPLIYLEHENGKFIRNAGQVILNHCNGVLVWNNELTNTSIGVQVLGSTFVRIVGNTIANNFHGISVVKSIAVNIVNNDVTDNMYDGIGVFHSGSCRVSFNEVSKNNIGIYFYGTFFNSLYLNSVHDNEKCNYLIDSALFPFIINT